MTMSVESKVADHYTHGALERVILDALRAAGKDIETITPSDLSGADEFHLGWRAATVDLANDLGLSADTKLLDIGCGLGGPARYFAQAFKCRVTGIDLTEEFVDVANALTGRFGLSELASFQQASALTMPFADKSFDRATLIHVGMNLENKAAVFAQTRRVLAQGGLFCIYDIMRFGNGEIPYPMPWAQTLETSFIDAPEDYRSLLVQAGFSIVSEKNRRDMALKLAQEMREDAARNGPPPLSLHTLIGPAATERLGNVMSCLAAGTIAPIQIIARAM